MRKSKLCILTCCVGLCWATIVAAQPAATGSDDQERALQALRQAEATPLDQSAAPPIKAAKKKKKAAKETAPVPAQPEPAISAPAISAPAGISDDQTKALEALRQAEAQPIVPDQIPAPAAPAITSAPAAPAAPTVTVAPIAPSVTVEPAAPAAPAQTAPSQTIAAEKAAADQARAKAKKDAAARKKAQEEAARSVKRVERLQNDTKNAPAIAKVASAPPSINTNVLSSKEQKLADLLRRYQADEITPYEYHLERAKIVAEP